MIVTAFAAAGAMLLVWAGVDHVREPAVSAARLGIFRSQHGRSVVAALGVSEIAVGVTALAALAVSTPVGRWPLAAQGALCLGFLGYLLVRYRRNDRGDCACARTSAQIGAAGLLRAGTLAIASIAAAASYPAAALPSALPTGAHVALGVAASVALCLLLHALPPAVDGLARRIGTRRYA